VQSRLPQRLVAVRNPADPGTPEDFLTGCRDERVGRHCFGVLTGHRLVPQSLLDDRTIGILGLGRLKNRMTIASETRDFRY
jgi:hypothetical protein